MINIDTNWLWSYTYSSLIYNYLSTYICICNKCGTVPITTNVVSLNLAHGEVLSIQHYVINIKFVSDLHQFGGFLWGTLTSSTIKTDHHDITEILLKVMLKMITPTPLHPGENTIHYSTEPVHLYSRRHGANSLCLFSHSCNNNNALL